MQSAKQGTFPHGMVDKPKAKLVEVTYGMFVIKELIGAAKIVQPATHQAPEIYVLQVLVKDLQPVYFGYEDENARDNDYELIKSAMIHE